MPLLEALAQGFFWNLLEFGCRIRFVFHGCETHLLEAHFYSREKPKITQSEIQTVRLLGDDRNAFCRKELLHNKRYVARCDNAPIHT
jgi:hypothetical protein